MQKVNTRGAVRYLSDRGVCFARKTLEIWRIRGKGPKYRRISGRIFYDIDALDEFLRGKQINPVCDPKER